MIEAALGPLLSSLLLAAPPGQAPQPAGLSSCLLVVAAPGTKTENDGVTEFWHTVNAQIAAQLVEKLSAAGRAAAIEVVPQDTPGDRFPELVALALARERCGQVLDLRHRLGGGSGPDAFFAFEAVVLGVSETERGFTLGPEMFRETYRFSLTEEVLKELSPAGVAASLETDLTAKGIPPGATDSPAP